MSNFTYHPLSQVKTYLQSENEIIRSTAKDMIILLEQIETFLTSAIKAEDIEQIKVWHSWVDTSLVFDDTIKFYHTELNIRKAQIYRLKLIRTTPHQHIPFDDLEKERFTLYTISNPDWCKSRVSSAHVFVFEYKLWSIINPPSDQFDDNAFIGKLIKCMMPYSA